MAAKQKKLDAYLAEVFKEFIAIKDEDYKKSQEIFKSVFDEVKLKMGEKCNYFKKYSSQIIIAGSVDDGIKVSKLDEFDMDIVIRLPINIADEGEKGIIMEYDQPGFVKMKIKDCFDNLDKQPDWEKCHVVTKDWRDGDKYFLQNKFRSWMHAIVQKALNDMGGKVIVHGVPYLLTYKESGPAYTLNIKNDINQEEFLLDVDLVPVIRFCYPRWPSGYRNLKSVADNQVKDWYVVPKPNKALKDNTQKNRCWRLSFQVFEKEMMKNRQQLKTTIRLLKKLRDALEMKAIASYYIKTLFLWEIDANDDKYWQTKLSTLFHTMVKKFHDAIKEKNIPYFWHEDNNLIEGLKPTVQKIYLDKLGAVLKSIETNDVDAIVAALLTTSELQKFKESEFYQKQNPKGADVPDKIEKPLVVASKLNKSVSVPVGVDEKSKIINNLISKVDKLTSAVAALQVRVTKLEMSSKEVQKVEEERVNPIDVSPTNSQDSGISEAVSLIDF